MNGYFRWAGLACGLMWASAIALAGGQAAPQSAGRSTRDGVYAEAQAERGKAVFEGICTECHQPDMWKPEWDKKSVGDIYEFITQNMPEPAPGSLSPQQVRDVIAFFLKSNGLPAGPDELPAGFQAMKQIRMEPLP